MTARPAPRLKLLMDTNVLLDVVLERKPWVEDATALLDAVAKHRAEGCVAGHVITTVYYVVEHERNRAVAATAVSDLLQLLTVVPLGNADFQRPSASASGTSRTAPRQLPVYRSGPTT